MAEQRLEEIRKIRFEKAKKLRDLGINPYPSKAPSKHRANRPSNKFNWQSGNSSRTYLGNKRAW